MFTLCAEGAGLTRITKLLNAEGVPAPRPQQGRPRAWIASSVRAVLHRPLYRGEIVWNASQKRDRWGQQRQHARPEADWIQVAAPHLQIVSDELWQAAQAQLTERREQYANGDRAYRVSPYLLSGFARCALCGGGFASHTTSGVTDLAQVRYVKSKRPAGGTEEQKTYWIATVQYSFAEAAKDPKTRRWNPLGFKVIDFRPEPEAMPESTTSSEETGL